MIQLYFNSLIVNIEKIVDSKTKKETFHFDSLGFMNHDENTYEKFITNHFSLIDFIEILKAFSGNKLVVKKEYELDGFTAQTAEQNNVISLCIKLDTESDNNTIYLDKFDCQSIASKLSKSVSKCLIHD